MAAPTAPVLGLKCYMYYNSSSYGSPTWVLIDNVGDVEITKKKSKEKIDLRSQGGYSVFVATMIEWAATFEMVYDPADTKQAALKSAFDNSTAIEMLFLDGPSATAGSAGLRASMGVFDFSPPEKINGAKMVKVEVSPTYSANAPANYTAV